MEDNQTTCFFGLIEGILKLCNSFLRKFQALIQELLGTKLSKTDYLLSFLQGLQNVFLPTSNYSETCPQKLIILRNLACKKYVVSEYCILWFVNMLREQPLQSSPLIHPTNKCSVFVGCDINCSTNSQFPKSIIVMSDVLLSLLYFPLNCFCESCTLANSYSLVWGQI